jgi:hypothetical protein
MNGKTPLRKGRLGRCVRHAAPGGEQRYPVSAQSAKGTRNEVPPTTTLAHVSAPKLLATLHPKHVTFLQDFAGFVKEKVDNALLFQTQSPLSRQHHTAELWRHWLGRTEAM